MTHFVDASYTKVLLDTFSNAINKLAWCTIECLSSWQIIKKYGSLLHGAVIVKHSCQRVHHWVDSSSLESRIFLKLIHVDLYGYMGVIRTPRAAIFYIMPQFSLFFAINKKEHSAAAPQDFINYCTGVCSFCSIHNLLTRLFRGCRIADHWIIKCEVWLFVNYISLRRNVVYCNPFVWFLIGNSIFCGSFCKVKIALGVPLILYIWFCTLLVKNTLICIATLWRYGHLWQLL